LIRTIAYLFIALIFMSIAVAIVVFYRPSPVTHPAVTSPVTGTVFMNVNMPIKLAKVANVTVPVTGNITANITVTGNSFVDGDLEKVLLLPINETVNTNLRLSKYSPFSKSVYNVQLNLSNTLPIKAYPGDTISFENGQFVKTASGLVGMIPGGPRNLDNSYVCPIGLVYPLNVSNTLVSTNITGAGCAPYASSTNASNPLLVFDFTPLYVTNNRTDLTFYADFESNLFGYLGIDKGWWYQGKRLGYSTELSGIAYAGGSNIYINFTDGTNLTLPLYNYYKYASFGLARLPSAKIPPVKFVVTTSTGTTTYSLDFYYDTITVTGASGTATYPLIQASLLDVGTVLKDYHATYFVNPTPTVSNTYLVNLTDIYSTTKYSLYLMSLPGIMSANYDVVIFFDYDGDGVPDIIIRLTEVGAYIYPAIIFAHGSATISTYVANTLVYTKEDYLRLLTSSSGGDIYHLAPVLNSTTPIHFYPAKTPYKLPSPPSLYPGYYWLDYINSTFFGLGFGVTPSSITSNLKIMAGGYQAYINLIRYSPTSGFTKVATISCSSPVCTVDTSTWTTSGISKYVLVASYSTGGIYGIDLGSFINNGFWGVLGPVYTVYHNGYYDGEGFVFVYTITWLERFPARVFINANIPALLLTAYGFRRAILSTFVGYVNVGSYTIYRIGDVSIEPPVFVAGLNIVGVGINVFRYMGTTYSNIDFFNTKNWKLYTLNTTSPTYAFWDANKATGDYVAFTTWPVNYMYVYRWTGTGYVLQDTVPISASWPPAVFAVNDTYFVVGGGSKGSIYSLYSQTWSTMPMTGGYFDSIVMPVMYKQNYIPIIPGPNAVQYTAEDVYYSVAASNLGDTYWWNHDGIVAGADFYDFTSKILPNVYYQNKYSIIKSNFWFAALFTSKTITVTNLTVGDIIIVSSASKSIPIVANSSTVVIDVTKYFTAQDIINTIKSGGFTITLAMTPAAAIKMLPRIAVLLIRSPEGDWSEAVATTVAVNCTMNFNATNSEIIFTWINNTYYVNITVVQPVQFQLGAYTTFFLVVDTVEPGYIYIENSTLSYNITFSGGAFSIPTASATTIGYTGYITIAYRANYGGEVVLNPSVASISNIERMIVKGRILYFTVGYTVTS